MRFNRTEAADCGIYVLRGLFVAWWPDSLVRFYEHENNFFRPLIEKLIDPALPTETTFVPDPVLLGPSVSAVGNVCAELARTDEPIDDDLLKTTVARECAAIGLRQANWNAVLGFFWRWKERRILSSGCDPDSDMTEDAQLAVLLAAVDAGLSGHRDVDVEHTLISLLRDCGELTARVLVNFGADPLEILRTVSIPISDLSQVSEPWAEGDPLPASTPALKTAMKSAAVEARRFAQEKAGPEHLLLGVLGAKDSLAARLVRDHKISVDFAREQMAAILGVQIREPEIEAELEDGRAALESAAALSHDDIIDCCLSVVAGLLERFVPQRLARFQEHLGSYRYKLLRRIESLPYLRDTAFAVPVGEEDEFFDGFVDATLALAEVMRDLGGMPPPDHITTVATDVCRTRGLTAEARDEIIKRLISWTARHARGETTPENQGIVFQEREGTGSAPPSQTWQSRILDALSRVKVEARPQSTGRLSIRHEGVLLVPPEHIEHLRSHPGLASLVVDHPRRKVFVYGVLQGFRVNVARSRAPYHLLFAFADAHGAPLTRHELAVKVKEESGADISGTFDQTLRQVHITTEDLLSHHIWREGAGYLLNPEFPTCVILEDAE